MIRWPTTCLLLQGGVLKRAEEIVRGYKHIFEVWLDENLKWKVKDDEWGYEGAIAGRFPRYVDIIGAGESDGVYQASFHNTDHGNYVNTFV